MISYVLHQGHVTPNQLYIYSTVYDFSLCNTAVLGNTLFSNKEVGGVIVDGLQVAVLHRSRPFEASSTV